MDENILSAIKEVRSNSKDRNFTQSFDLIVNLKLLDINKPENKMEESVVLPNGRGKEAKIAIFSDKIKENGYKIYGTDDIDKFANDKRSLRKMAKNTNFLLADPELMVEIGKKLGKILAPRGKMPKPIVGGHKRMVDMYKKSIRIKIKDSPAIQCIVGTEKMEDKEIAENVEHVLNYLKKNLPKGRNNIDDVMIKLTMSKPVKID